MAELMQRFGLTDPNQLFGGSLGLIKTSAQDAYDETGLSSEGYKKALLDSAQKVGKDLGIPVPDVLAYDNETDSQAFWRLPEFQKEVEGINNKFKSLNYQRQITPEELQRTFAEQNAPGTTKGLYVSDTNSLKWDADRGLYLDSDADRSNRFAIGNNYEPEDSFGSFIGNMLSDPLFQGLALYAGGVAGGFGGAGAGAGEAAAPSAIGQTAYGLGPSGGGLGFNASGFLGGAGATPGVGFVAPSAAGWGGFGTGTLGTGLGAIEAANYGLGAGQGNLGFNASGAFGGTSTLGGTAGSGLGIGIPEGAGWWGAGSGIAQAAPTGSLFDTLKANYDKYGKPVSRVNSAVNALGGGSGGRSGQMVTPQDEGLPEAAGTTYYPSGNIGAGFGAGPPGSGYGGFPGFPAMGGLPQTPGYQFPQQAQQDPNWFIPEYLKRGVIGR